MNKLGTFIFTALISASSLLHAATYHVATTGNDANSGSESSLWKTIGTSIQKLVPGDELLIHKGVYKEQAFTINTKDITIRNFNNEAVTIDNSYQEFQTVPNQEWTLFDKENQVFRSVKKYPLRKVMRGYFFENGKLYRLVPYFRYKDLVSNNETYTANAPMYVGPGMFYSPDNGYLHIRLKHTAIQKQLNKQYPSTTDPNNLALYLYPDNKDMFRFEKTASNITIEGLTLKCGDRVFYTKNGAHDIDIQNCNILGGKTHVSCDPGSYNLTFSDIIIEDGIPDWISWEDVKEKIMYDGLTEYVAGDLKLGGFNVQKNVNNVSIINSVINRTFDGVMYAEGNGLSIKRCVFRGTRDDSIELETGASHAEIAHNQFFKVSKALSRRDYGKSPQYPGTKYIHHNVIDCDVSMFHGRPGSKIYDRTDAPQGFIRNTAFGTHGESDPGIGDPWKLYNNTIIIGHAISGSPSEKGIGCEYEYNEFIKGNPQEVYNNIFIQTTDNRMINNVRVHDGSQIFDGNLYWRNNGGQSASFIGWKSETGVQDFFDLVSFKESSFFTASKLIYPEGFENSGIWINPFLDAEYRPSGTGVSQGTVDLSTKGWPDNTSKYRGAVEPLITEPAPEPEPKPDLEKLKELFGKLKTSFNAYIEEIELMLQKFQ